jgi:hypothetical protein
VTIKSPIFLVFLLLFSIYGSITTTSNKSNMHSTKTIPFTTTFKHGKKNLHQLAKAIQPWGLSKKKLERAAASAAIMEFHERPPWSRFTFPEAEIEDDGKSWYKGDEKKFMARGELLGNTDPDEDQQSWYEGNEFFDTEDNGEEDDWDDNASWHTGDEREFKVPAKIEKTDINGIYQEVIRQHELDIKRRDAEVDRVFELIYG